MVSRNTGSVYKTSIKQLAAFPSTVIPFTLGAGVLLLSGILGYMADRLPLMLVLGSIGGLVFILIALRSMPLALTLLLVATGTVGFTIGTGTATPIPFAMPVLALLVGIWLSRMVFVERGIHLAYSPVNLPFLAFVGSALVSWIAGYAFWDWRVPGQGNLLMVQVGQLAIFAMTVAALLLVLNHRLTEAYLKLWTAILIVLGVISYATWVFIRYYGIFPKGGGTIIVWAVVLLWAQLLFNPSLKPWMRLAGLGITLFWAYWVYTQVFVWKGGWLTSVMAFLILLWFKSRRAFLVLAFALLMIVASNWSFLGPRLVGVELSSGSTLRTLYWYDVIRMTSRSVLLGLGPANYKLDWYEPSFIPLSRLASGWDTWNAWGYSPTSHNTFVDIFAQTGLIGLGFFAWGLGASWLISYRIAARLPPGFLKGYAFAVFSGIAALIVASFAFADWLLPFVYNLTITGFGHTVYSWLLLGSLLAFQAQKGENDA